MSQKCYECGRETPTYHGKMLHFEGCVHLPAMSEAERVRKLYERPPPLPKPCRDLLVALTGHSKPGRPVINPPKTAHVGRLPTYKD